MHTLEYDKSQLIGLIIEPVRSNDVGGELVTTFNTVDRCGKYFGSFHFCNLITVQFVDILYFPTKLVLGDLTC